MLMSTGITGLGLETNTYMSLFFSRWWPPPLFTLLLTILNISIFTYHSIYFTSIGIPIGWGGPAPLTSVLIFNPHKKVQIWRFFTYSLVHSGLEHILVNSVLLLLVGLSLELSHGWWRVAVVYMAGVAAGSLSSSIFKPNTFLAGASAGVYALTCAHLAALLLNWKEDSLILRQRLSQSKATAPIYGKVVRVVRILVVLGIISIDVVTVVWAAVKQVDSATSYTAHLAGVVMGVVVGLVILKNRRVEFWEKWLRVGCCLVAGSYLIILVVLQIALPSIMLQDYQNITAQPLD